MQGINLWGKRRQICQYMLHQQDLLVQPLETLVQNELDNLFKITRTSL